MNKPENLLNIFDKYKNLTKKKDQLIPNHLLEFLVIKRKPHIADKKHYG